MVSIAIIYLDQQFLAILPPDVFVPSKFDGNIIEEDSARAVVGIGEELQNYGFANIIV